MGYVQVSRDPEYETLVYKMSRELDSRGWRPGRLDMRESLTRIYDMMNFGWKEGDCVLAFAEPKPEVSLIDLQHQIIIALIANVFYI